MFNRPERELRSSALYVGVGVFPLWHQTCRGRQEAVMVGGERFVLCLFGHNPILFLDKPMCPLCDTVQRNLMLQDEVQALSEALDKAKQEIDDARKIIEGREDQLPPKELIL